MLTAVFTTLVLKEPLPVHALARAKPVPQTCFIPYDRPASQLATDIEFLYPVEQAELAEAERVWEEHNKVAKEAKKNKQEAKETTDYLN